MATGLPDLRALDSAHGAPLVDLRDAYPPAVCWAAHCPDAAVRFLRDPELRRRGAVLDCQLS
jgi:hypothetical protein